MELQTLIGTALVDRKFHNELLNGKRPALLAEFDLTDEEQEIALAMEIMEQECSEEESPNTETFLIECLAWGLLRAYGIEGPPVPVRKMVRRPLPIFERLTLLELSLGLYNAAYKSCLDGSRLIVVDIARPHAVQRASMARELYVAFCRSPRAIELHWPCREQPYVCSELFARCLLMPAAWAWSTCAEAIPLEDMAACFGVPVRMVSQRLSEMDHQALDPAAGLFAHNARGCP